jgi:hypothetical protein
MSIRLALPYQEAYCRMRRLIKMKPACLIIAFATMFITTNAQAQTSRDIVGCWRLESLVIDPDGTKMEPFGPKPSGQMIFDADGHMSSIIMRPDLPDEWQATGDRVTTTLITYFGTYDLKGKTLTLKPEGSSRNDWKGRTLTRVVEVAPNKELVFRTEAPSVPSRIIAKPCQ